MTANRFRALARVLAPFVSDTYSLLDAVDAVVTLDSDVVDRGTIASPDKNATYNWTTGLWDFDHGYLVNVCKDNDVVLMYLGQSKKINAIKELRRVVPGATLKSCKDAVEDSLVTLAAQLRSDPWGYGAADVNAEGDGPPF